MSEKLPSVTIIIAARPDQAEIEAVKSARRFDYPPELIEVIVARGRQPSVQRNAAMKAAHGEWIYFLDDDSMAPGGNLRQAAKCFADPAVKMVGGPNLCPSGAPLLEQVFAVVLSSWLAFGPSHARYASVGKTRETGEKELILCNLLARRDAIMEMGGFNEALYPNEENALMDELQKRGGRLIYDPDLVVYRRPRHSLKSFARMLLTYGRGRAQQFRLHPTFGSVLNFVPPLFCFYLLGLLVIELAAASGSLVSLRPWAAVPLAVYVGAIVVQTVVSMRSSGPVRSLLALPLLAASHVLYGLGIWHGLFTVLPRGGNGRRAPQIEVVLETVTR